MNSIATAPDGAFDKPSDSDPIETREWADSLNSVIDASGGARAQFLLRQLEEIARRKGVFAGGQPFSSYRNTIPVAQQGAYPGDLEIEERLT